MQPTQPMTYDEQQKVEAHAPYLKVWVALLVLTVLEYLYARLLAGNTMALIVGLTGMALVKAALVAMYFMHVKFEGRWVVLMMLPVVIMAVLLVLALVPDMIYPPSTPRPGEAAPVQAAAGPIVPGQAG